MAVPRSRGGPAPGLADLPSSPARRRAAGTGRRAWPGATSLPRFSPTLRDLDVTLVAVSVLPRSCQSGTACPAAPRFQALLETRTGTSPICIAAQACEAHIGSIIQGLTVWAHDHDITEGQLAVLTIDPAQPSTETQGLLFWIIQLAEDCAAR